MKPKIVKVVSFYMQSLTWYRKRVQSAIVFLAALRLHDIISSVKGLTIQNFFFWGSDFRKNTGKN